MSNNKDNNETIFFITDNLKLSKEGNKYYKNGIELKKIDENTNDKNTDNENTNDKNTDNENYFKLELKQAVSNFINKSFKHIVVLVGAGASVVNDNNTINNEYGKTINMIAEKVYEELKEKKYELTYLTNEKDKETIETFSLEEIISIIENKEVNKIHIGNKEYNCNKEGDSNKKDGGNKEDNGSKEENGNKKDGGNKEDNGSKEESGNKKDDSNKEDNNNKSNESIRFNLENFLSKLITYNQLVKNENTEKMKNSQKAIFDIIKKNVAYEYDSKVFRHTSLIKILSKKLSNENKLSIVTTNYDTLIEDAAELINYTVIDGFSFSRKPKFDDDLFEWHLSRHVSNVNTQQNIYKSQVIDLLKLHGSLTWRKNEKGEVLRKDKYAPGDAVMIFPSTNKYMHSYEDPYFELFTKFQELLKRPNTLLITTGFSFSDNHISQMIIQAINHNTGLYVLISDFDITPDKPNKNWKKLMDMIKDHDPIAFLRATLNDELTDYLGGSSDESR